jgi:hypothetical protein
MNFGRFELNWIWFKQFILKRINTTIPLGHNQPAQSTLARQARLAAHCWDRASARRHWAAVARLAPACRRLGEAGRWTRARWRGLEFILVVWLKRMTGGASSISGLIPLVGWSASFPDTSWCLSGMEQGQTRLESRDRRFVTRNRGSRWC